MKKYLVILFLWPVLAFGQLSSSLVAYWSMDATSGVTQVDSVGSNDGTVTGATVNQIGKLGRAVSFDGSNDFITAPDVADLQMETSDMTFTAWIYMADLPATYGAIIGSETMGATWFIGSDGHPNFGVYDYSDTKWASATPTDQWVFVAMVYDQVNNLIDFYINSTHRGWGAYTAYCYAGASSNTIGSETDGYYDFNGLIDEVGIWKRCLSHSEILELYNSGSGLAYPFGTSSTFTPTPGSHVWANKNGAHQVTKKNGMFVYFKKPYAIPSTDTAITVYETFDWETQSLGLYTEAEINADYEVYGMEYAYPTERIDIVTEEINGIETQVFRVQLGTTAWAGFGGNFALDTDYVELYLSYNVKFDKEFDATKGKLPGLGGLQIDPWMGDDLDPVDGYGDLPDPQYGFLDYFLFWYGNGVASYHYDITKYWVPWSSEPSLYENPVYMNNGQWYNITKRIVMNTFTGSVANYDGISESWIDGRMVYQETGMRYMATQHDTMKIDMLRIVTHSNVPQLTTQYNYFDNFTTWINPNDSTYNNRKLHDPAGILVTPATIYNRDVVYDTFINTEQSIISTSVTNGSDLTWLIDAGAGNTVSLAMSSYGTYGADYFIIYDGKTSDSDILLLSNNSSGINTTKTSTGRYMFIRLSTDVSVHTCPGFAGVITFN